jgi:hypothetical protein
MFYSDNLKQKTNNQSVGLALCSAACLLSAGTHLDGSLIGETIHIDLDASQLTTSADLTVNQNAPEFVVDYSIGMSGYTTGLDVYEAMGMTYIKHYTNAYNQSSPIQTWIISNLFWDGDPLAGKLIGVDIVSDTGGFQGVVPNFIITDSSMAFVLPALDGTAEPTTGTIVFKLLTEHNNPVVPEPSTYALMGTMLAAVGFARRRTHKQER